MRGRLDRGDGSALDSNERPCSDALSVRYWKEFHSSVLIAQTMVAELVNKAGASRGQGLPCYMFYGAFTTETKHIHH